MARIPYRAPEGAPPELQAVYAEIGRQRGSIGHLWQAMAHCPELMRRVGAVGEHLRFQSPLPARLREIVTLAVAGHWRCVYEESVHGPLAANLGVSDAARAALADGRLPDELDADEAAAVRYALALLREGRASDELVEPIRERFGDAGLVDLSLQVGYYAMIAVFLNGLEVEPDPRP